MLDIGMQKRKASERDRERDALKLDYYKYDTHAQ